MIDHAAARPLAHRARGGGRCDHREAEGGRPDRRGDREGDRRRGARLRAADSSRTSTRPMTLADGAGFHDDPGYFKVEYQKTQAVTAGRRQARRQQVSDEGARRAERRAAGQARSGGEAGREPQGHAEPGAAGGGRAMTRSAARRLRASRRVAARWPALTADGRSAPSRRSIAARSRRRASRRSCACRRGRSATLANGAELVVSEKHDLPLVSFTINFVGGADQFEPADKPRRGVADRGDAERRHEDARRRRALERAAAARHAASRPASAASRGSIGFVVDRGQVRADARRSSPTCSLNPTFPDDALERLRGAAARRVDAGARSARRRSPPACSRACSTARAIRTARR